MTLRTTETFPLDDKGKDKELRDHLATHRIRTGTTTTPTATTTDLEGEAAKVAGSMVEKGRVGKVRSTQCSLTFSAR